MNTKENKSIQQLSYIPQKRVDVSVDILDPYKSHTNLSWIGCHTTDYSRDWSINNLPFVPVKREEAMSEFQKTGQSTSFCLGIAKVDYCSTNSLAKSYKAMDTTKHRHRQLLWNEHQSNKQQMDNEQTNAIKLDRATLCGTNWSFGNVGCKNEWTTDAQSSYIKYDDMDQCKSTISTSELQKTNLYLGGNKRTIYDTTTKSSYTAKKPVPQCQRTMTKAMLQASRVTLGDGRTRYWEKSTK